jgi:two-component sensor histidine kinase
LNRPTAVADKAGILHRLCGQGYDQLSIDVNIDDCITTADISVSLGLIVTELVINALKHAFPDSRDGLIKVNYHAHGPNWTLSVSDDGIGMPKGAARAKPGLGTSIVQALAAQLHGIIKVSDATPGTVVSIAYTQIAAVANDATPAVRAV